jgi:methyltransferase (TIGR00027 family)
MVIVAVEQYEPAEQRIITDPLASHFLPRGTQPVVRLARWQPIQRRLFRFTEQTAHGIWGSMLCRKRAIDDALCAALPGISAVVNLGAGLDTRAFRLSGLVHLPIWELDLPEMGVVGYPEDYVGSDERGLNAEPATVGTPATV